MKRGIIEDKKAGGQEDKLFMRHCEEGVSPTWQSRIHNILDCFANARNDAFNNSLPSYPPIFLSSKKAFTLAEVLITLGIIGVVAAMTLPTLIKNYQKTVWTNQLKKSYATLNQGFRTMMANEGADYIVQTAAFRRIPGGGCGWDYAINYSQSLYAGRCNNFLNEMKKVFKITYVGSLDNYKIGSLKEPNNKTTKTGYFIMFSDGTMMFDYYFSSGGGSFWLDINGSKGPNVSGRDIFAFSIKGETDTVIPFGSLRCKELVCTDWPYWREGSGNCKKDSYLPMSFRFSHTCAGRVLEEGKMNY